MAEVGAFPEGDSCDQSNPDPKKMPIPADLVPVPRGSWWCPLIQRKCWLKLLEHLLRLRVTYFGASYSAKFLLKLRRRDCFGSSQDESLVLRLSYDIMKKSMEAVVLKIFPDHCRIIPEVSTNPTNVFVEVQDGETPSKSLRISVFPEHPDDAPA